MRLEIWQHAENSVALPVLSWTVKGTSSPEPGISCGAVFLFDVTSINNARNMDLRSYATVAPKNCFSVSAKDCPHILFEAKSEKEERRITRGLKLIIAWVNSIAGEHSFERSSEEANVGFEDEMAIDSLDVPVTFSSIVSKSFGRVPDYNSGHGSSVEANAGPADEISASNVEPSTLSSTCSRSFGKKKPRGKSKPTVKAAVNAQSIAQNDSERDESDAVNVSHDVSVDLQNSSNRIDNKVESVINYDDEAMENEFLAVSEKYLVWLSELHFP